MKQLGQLTVIMSSHGTVTEVKLADNLSAELPDEIRDKVVNEVRLKNAYTACDVSNIFTNWFSNIRALTSGQTINALYKGTDQIPKTNKFAAVFNVLMLNKNEAIAIV